MTWKKCGHERTVENTCGVSIRSPKGRCRDCQRALDRRYSKTEKGRASTRRRAAAQTASGYSAAKKVRAQAEGRLSEKRRRHYQNHREERLAYQNEYNRWGMSPWAAAHGKTHELDPHHVAVLSDIQIPFQDELALGLALKIIADTKPDLVVLNGDITDCYAISDFDKDPKHGYEFFTQEKEEARELLRRLTEMTHHPTVVWLAGNHEQRWDRLMFRSKIAALMAHAQGCENYGDFIGVKDFDVKFYKYGDSLKLGHLYVTHGYRVSQHSAYTARMHQEDMGVSVMVGHTHRQGEYARTTMKGVYKAWEQGCLCHLDMEYMTRLPNWQQGFAMVDYSSIFKVSLVEIIDEGHQYTGIYGGKSYSVTPETITPIGPGQ